LTESQVIGNRRKRSLFFLSTTSRPCSTTTRARFSRGRSARRCGS